MNCPKCGAPVGPEDAFCPNCGAPLRAPTAAPLRVSAPAGTPRRSRPAILILITILTAFHGLMLLILFFFLFVSFISAGFLAGWIAGFAGGMVPVSIELPIRLALAVYAMLWLGISFLGAAYGLSTFQPWAPMLALVVWGLFILAIFIMLLAVQGGVVMGLLEMANAGLAIYYLLRPEVRELYA